MPKGPRGERRPADVVSAAVMVGRIATGEATDSQSARAKAGALGGKVGGKARAASMTPAERTAAAKKAAKARWEEE
jgi:hypothetical protein